MKILPCDETALRTAAALLNAGGVAVIPTVLPDSPITARISPACSVRSMGRRRKSDCSNATESAFASMTVCFISSLTISAAAAQTPWQTGAAEPSH